MELTVVLPAYQEAENLAVLIPDIRRALASTGISYEIAVIDAPSALDETPRICKEERAAHFPRTGGPEYGNAVRTGIRVARGDYILFMDADGSHPAEFIPELLKHRKANDIVIASRYVRDGGSENNAILKGMSLLLNRTYGLVLGLNCRDVSNSFRVYRADVLRRLDLRCADFDVVAEILIRAFAYRKDLRVAEIPFRFHRRIHGKSKRHFLKLVASHISTLVRLFGMRLSN